MFDLRCSEEAVILFYYKTCHKLTSLHADTRLVPHTLFEMLKYYDNDHNASETSIVRTLLGPQ